MIDEGISGRKQSLALAGKLNTHPGAFARAVKVVTGRREVSKGIGKRRWKGIEATFAICVEIELLR